MWVSTRLCGLRRACLPFYTWLSAGWVSWLRNLTHIVYYFIDLCYRYSFFLLQAFITLLAPAIIVSQPMHTINLVSILWELCEICIALLCICNIIHTPFGDVIMRNPSGASVFRFEDTDLLHAINAQCLNSSSHSPPSFCPHTFGKMLQVCAFVVGVCLYVFVCCGCVCVCVRVRVLWVWMYINYWLACVCVHVCAGVHVVYGYIF